MLALSVVPARAEFESGRTLAPLMEAYKKGASEASQQSKLMAIEYRNYVIAGHDVMIAVGTICGQQATQEEIVRLVTEFVDENPEKLDSPAFELTYLALIDAYACDEEGKDGAADSNRSHATGFFVDGHALGEMASEYVNFAFNGAKPDYQMVAAFSGYVGGAHDAWSTGESICEEFKSKGQLANLIADYTISHSSDRNTPAISVFATALIDAGYFCEN